MFTRHITITYRDALFDSVEKKASLSTVLDAFGCICGFYTDDFLMLQEKSDKAYEELDLIKPEIDGSNIDRFIICFQAVSDVEYINVPKKNSPNYKPGYPPDNNDEKIFTGLGQSPDKEKKKGDWLLDNIRPIFVKLKEKLPVLKRVINSFWDNRLWEVAIFSQTHSYNSELRTQVADKCANVSDVMEKNNDENDIHFLYTKLYLEYLRLFLLNDNRYLNNRFGNSLNHELSDLFNRTVNTFQKTNSAVFLKLSAMISGEMGNLDYSEKMYNRYIGLISKEGNVRKEIGKAFYDLGHLYENYSHRETYTLSTIYTASKYYDMSYKSDQGNYRALYKKAFPPQMKEISSDIIHQLMKLQKVLDQLIKEQGGTLRAHLYRYKITNQLLIYSINTWQHSDEFNLIYIKELEDEYRQISIIWEYLCPDDTDGKWLNELSQYLNTKVRDVVDMLLALKKNGIDDVFLYKRSQIQKTKISDNDNSRLEPVGALS